jgi:pimeloyl-ACP methyl ester carboxylesterase
MTDVQHPAPDTHDAEPRIDEPTEAITPDARQSSLAEPGGWPEKPATTASFREALPGQLLMIPGLGLTQQLFFPQRRAYGEAIVCRDWPQPRDNEALGDYARRFAEQLKPQLDPDQPLFLAGASFGGLVALEMADVLDPRATFLIGSARSHHALPLRLQLANRVVGALPSEALRFMLPKLAVAFCCREGLDDRSFGLVRRMVRQADPAFVAWAMNAANDWDFEGPLTERQKPVYQIHGRHDWVLPPRVEDCDTLLPTDHHLLNLSHPQTINRYLADHCWQHVTDADNPGPRFRYY